MKRTIPWSAKPTAVVEARLASLHGAQRPVKLFLVQTLGPTLFIVRHETTPSTGDDATATDLTTTTTTTTENDITTTTDPTTTTDNDTAPLHPPTRSTSRKYKVAIGNPQRCTCGDRSICIHILFCMTKVLGVPKDNPLTWQRALVEREINDVCSGQVARAARMAATGGNQRRGRQDLHTNFLRRHRSSSSSSTNDLKKKKQDESSNKRLEVQRKEIEVDDTCPVCLESLLVVPADNDASMPLSYCKRGCGKNVHVAVRCDLSNDLFFGFYKPHPLFVASICERILTSFSNGCWYPNIFFFFPLHSCCFLSATFCFCSACSSGHNISMT